MQVDPTAPVPANPRLPFSRPVVERASVFANSDPGAATVTAYHYASGEFDPPLVAFRGFARVERTGILSADPNGTPGEGAGTTVLSTYGASAACAGRPETTQIAFGTDVLRTETRTYRAIARPSGAAGPVEVRRQSLRAVYEKGSAAAPYDRPVSEAESQALHPDLSSFNRNKPRKLAKVGGRLVPRS